MLLAIREQPFADWLQLGQIHMLPFHHQLQINYILRPNIILICCAVQLLSNLVNDTHQRKWPWFREIQLSEQLQDILRQRYDIKGISFADLIILQFKINGAPWMILIGQLDFERLHHISGLHIGRPGFEVLDQTPREL